MLVAYVSAWRFLLPRYDYECTFCNHRFELKQSFDSEPVAPCPECHSTSRRKFHSVPVVFKGSGWYVNDYGKKSSGTTSLSDSKESSNKDGDAVSKADVKSGSEPKTASASESSSGTDSKTESKTPAASAKSKDD